MKKEAENRKRKIKETMEQQENKQQDKYLNGIMSIVTLNANRPNNQKTKIVRLNKKVRVKYTTCKNTD